MLNSGEFVFRDKFVQSSICIFVQISRCYTNLNTSTKYISIFEESTLQIQPGDKVVQQTYVTHPWVITDTSNNCLGVYYPDGLSKNHRDSLRYGVNRACGYQRSKSLWALLNQYCRTHNCR